MINILHLRDSPWVCGPGRTILETASHIDETKYTYIVGAFAGVDGKNSPLISAAEERGLRTFPIKEKRSIDFSTITQICNYMDKNDIHILHSHETRSDLLALICQKKRDIRIVSTVHGWIANNTKSSVMVWFDKRLLRSFDRVIVVSDRMKKQAIASGIKPEKIRRLYNSLLVDDYLPDKEEDVLRKELSLPEETKLIANIGRLSPEKGQKDFLTAASTVLRKGLKAKFVFIGVGPEQQKLEKIARDLRIDDSVIFAGFRKDMKTLYNSIDLVVQSSYTEGLPNVILEALLMETPVVATDVGGTAEVTSRDKYGEIVKPHDHDAIAKHIEKFIQDPSTFLRKAINGREHVRNNFNFTNRTSQLCSIYDELMSAKK